MIIERDDIEKIIEIAPDARWRGIIALARYGGLRIPSELQGLKWCDIDFDEDDGSMFIHSPKTAHHEGKATRRCPIFPDLRPYLTDLRHLASEAKTPVDGLVISDAGKDKNLRKHFERLIARAKVKQWPKLFQNLRASCETEATKPIGARTPNETLQNRRFGVQMWPAAVLGGMQKIGEEGLEPPTSTV